MITSLLILLLIALFWWQSGRVQTMSKAGVPDDDAVKQRHALIAVGAFVSVVLTAFSFAITQLHAAEVATYKCLQCQAVLQSGAAFPPNCPNGHGRMVKQ